MALVRVDTAKSRPEIALLAALDDFKTVLTDEQKRQLSATIKPDATDAIRVATQIDQENTNRWGRCLGPRLVSFLESVQQFSKVVDTFVSSNPEIAALLWGGVRLSLLLVNNYVSYFEKLSGLFMQLGRSCPRLAEFGTLYKTSIGLQRSLCEYYAVVVHLCKSVIEFAKKPYVFQTASAILLPFDMQFGPFQKQLSELSQMIRDEASLASKKAQDQEIKLQTKERHMARRHRNLGEKFQKQVSQEQMEARLRAAQRVRLKVLDSISVYDYQKSWKYSRKQCLKGTSSWIFEKSEWKDWLSYSSSVSLCCTGILGSGKTVLTASVVAYLLSKSSSTDRISYFFCMPDDLESTTARTMIGSIARQLLSDLSLDVFSMLDQELRDTKPDVEWIFEVLSSRLSANRQYFIILDGLNEVEDVEIKEVVEVLERFLALPTLTFKIFYSNQTIHSAWLPLKANFTWHIAVDNANISSDINHYIDVLLEEKLESEALQLGDPRLILLIQKALKEGANGMFLWAVFQIEHICAQQTDETILRAVQNLPKDLPKIFERILKKLSISTDAKLAGRIFDWLAVAKRPLTLEELREAIAIDPLQKELIAARLPNNMLLALSCCGPLVIVDDEQGTVHFTHQSVRHHLTLNASDPSLTDYHVDLEAADARAGEICITYLNFNIFDRRVAKAPAKGTKTVEIPGEIVRGILPRTNLVSKLTAIRFLKDKQTLNRAVQRQMQDVVGGRVQQEHYFLLYARKWWIFHAKFLRAPPGPMWDMWCQLLTDENDHVDKPWPSHAPSDHSRYQHMIEWAKLNDHGALFVYMVTSTKVIHVGEPLIVAEKLAIALAKNRRWTYLRDFLELHSDSANSNQDDFRTKLLIPGLWFVREDIVQICLTDGADVRKTHPPSIFSVFNITMEQPSFSTKRDIYQSLRKFKDWGQMLDSWSPLSIAAAAGSLHMVDLILSKAYLGTKDVGGDRDSFLPRALLVAAAFGYYEIVHRLLNLERTVIIHDHEDDDIGHESRIPRRFNVNTTDNSGWTSLMYITAWGNLDLVELLLKRKANPEVGTYTEDSMESFTSLSIAISLGRKDIQDRFQSWREIQGSLRVSDSGKAQSNPQLKNTIRQNQLQSTGDKGVSRRLVQRK